MQGARRRVFAYVLYGRGVPCPVGSFAASRVPDDKVVGEVGVEGDGCKGPPFGFEFSARIGGVGGEAIIGRTVPEPDKVRSAPSQ